MLSNPFAGLPAPRAADVVAIDFETANRRRDSACCVGVALLDGTSMVARGAILINPESEFDTFNSRLTGINSSSVVDADTFVGVWPRLKALLHGRTVIAHNAGFDISVLNGMLSRYQLGGLDADVWCTLKLAKVVWPGQDSYSLGRLAASVGLPRFQHHRADEDAATCMRLLLAMCRERSVQTPRALFDAVKVVPRCMRESSMNAAATNREAPEHRTFKEKNVCFTGAMVSMRRKDAAALVVKAGGTVSGTVSKATDYLVLGEADFFNFVDGHATTKSKKAMRLIEGGAPIEIISEHTAGKMLAREDEDAV